MEKCDQLVQQLNQIIKKLPEIQECSIMVVYQIALIRLSKNLTLANFSLNKPWAKTKYLQAKINNL